MNFNRSNLRRCFALTLPLFLAGAAFAPDESTPATNAPATSEPPQTHTVSRAPLKTRSPLDAVLESVEMAPIKLEPKAWADLTVIDAVPHGARVRKGDVLVKLDAEKLRDQLEDLEQDRPAGTIALELAAADLANLEQTTPRKLKAANRAQRIAEEDNAYFEKTGRAQREKAAQFNLKRAEQGLEGAREEMRQLEKMYKNDNLVEETEEIVLKRQRFAVESGEYAVEATKQAADLAQKTAIPRERETLKAAKRDQEIALELAEETLPRNLAKKRLDVEKLKRDQKKGEKRFADLKRDLESLGNVRAPMDGVVYYGACESGKWTTGAVVAKKLVPGGKLSPNEVFMTVVKPDKLCLRAVVQEADLAQYKPGVEGKAALVSAPDKKLPVKLVELGSVPLPTGGFDAKLSVQTTPDVRAMPGMNCKVTLGEREKAEPLVVPKDSVFAEGPDRVVYLLKSGGKSERRAVKLGESEGKLVEILEGLAEGDKIFIAKPK